MAAAADRPKSERDGHRPEGLLTPLCIEFLCPVNIRVCDFAAGEHQSDAADQIGDQRLLGDAVAVIEGIAVEQYVSGDGISVYGGEKVDAHKTERAQDRAGCLASPPPDRFHGRPRPSAVRS